MQKFTLKLLTLVMVFCLISCGQKTSSTITVSAEELGKRLAWIIPSLDSSVKVEIANEERTEHGYLSQVDIYDYDFNRNSQENKKAAVRIRIFKNAQDVELNKFYWDCIDEFWNCYLAEDEIGSKFYNSMKNNYVNYCYGNALFGLSNEYKEDEAKMIIKAFEKIIVDYYHPQTKQFLLMKWKQPEAVNLS